MNFLRDNFKLFTVLGFAGAMVFVGLQCLMNVAATFGGL